MSTSLVPVLRIGLLTLLASSWPAGAVTAQEEIGVSIGTPAQPVRLDDLDGRPVDLGELFGRRPVLLEFWALWCENCEALTPQLVAAHEKAPLP